MAELLYGLRMADNKIVSVDSVPNGKDCGCICEVCKTPLIAKQGKHNAHHFAHDGKACDIKHANETALHRMAKEIIAEEGKISVPALTVPLGSIKLGRIPPGIRAKLPTAYEYRQAEILNCQSVDLEKHLPGFVPDIIANTSNGEYLIEIAVTHFVDEEKKACAVEYNAPTLEIDLSRFVEEPISSGELRKKLIASTELREWTHHPDYEEAEKQAQKYYEGLQIIKDYHKQQQLKAEQNAAATKAREEADRKLHVAAERENKIKAEKRKQREKKLVALLEPQNYNAALVQLRNDKAFYEIAKKDFEFFKKEKKFPWFVDIPITGEMIFRCDRRIWQGRIFDRYIYNRWSHEPSFNYQGGRGKHKSIFEELKDKHSIPIDYDLSYKISVDVGGLKEYWFRTEVIETYLMYLELLGFIAPQYNKTRPGYINRGWKDVKATHTIDAPNQKAADLLLRALKAANRRAPDINERVYQFILPSLSEIQFRNTAAQRTSEWQALMETEAKAKKETCEKFENWYLEHQKK